MFVMARFARRSSTTSSIQVLPDRDHDELERVPTRRTPTPAAIKNGYGPTSSIKPASDPTIGEHNSARWRTAHGGQWHQLQLRRSNQVLRLNGKVGIKEPLYAEVGLPSIEMQLGHGSLGVSLG